MKVLRTVNSDKMELPAPASPLLEAGVLVVSAAVKSGVPASAVLSGNMLKMRLPEPLDIGRGAPFAESERLRPRELL